MTNKQQTPSDIAELLVEKIWAEKNKPGQAYPRKHEWKHAIAEAILSERQKLSVTNKLWEEAIQIHKDKIIDLESKLSEVEGENKRLKSDREHHLYVHNADTGETKLIECNNCKSISAHLELCLEAVKLAARLRCFCDEGKMCIYHKALSTPSLSHQIALSEAREKVIRILEQERMEGAAIPYVVIEALTHLNKLSGGGG